jgi:prefoldin subunit 5
MENSLKRLEEKLDVLLEEAQKMESELQRRNDRAVETSREADNSESKEDAQEESRD